MIGGEPKPTASTSEDAPPAASADRVDRGDGRLTRPQERIPLAEDPPVFGGRNKNDVSDRLSGRDWVAIVFAASVLAIILVTGGIILYNWSAPVPDLTRIPLDQQKDAVERFREFNAVLSERTEKIFDLIITKALLPLFATLVGFILGTRAKHSG